MAEKEWECLDCGNVIAAEEKPESCPDCGSTDIEEVSLEGVEDLVGPEEELGGEELGEEEEEW